MKDWIIHNRALPAIYEFLLKIVSFSVVMSYANLIYMNSAIYYILHVLNKHLYMSENLQMSLQG